MEKMIDLRDLLQHEIIDLYSVEEQIIDALPGMIEKAGNPTLKRLLNEHLKVTEKHKSRLDEIKQIMNTDKSTEQEEPGFFSRLFGGVSSEHQKCRGMEGIIEEGEKIISQDMSPEVLDAAIIASAQKVEHYEICGYGTAVAYARELRLYNVTTLLEQTLDEEYVADASLTNLAVGKLNVEAEFAGSDVNNGTANSKTKAAGKKASASSTSKKSSATAPNAKAAPAKSSSKRTSPKSAPVVAKKLGNGGRAKASSASSGSAKAKASGRKTAGKRK